MCFYHKLYKKNITQILLKIKHHSNCENVLKSEYYWFGIFAISFMILQFISYEIRPSYKGENELIKYFLGVAPNFFPAIGMPAIFILFIQTASNAKSKWLKEYKFITANLVSLFGLVIWEFIQLIGKLRFDWNDILWTIIGALVFQLIWVVTPEKIKNQS